MATNVLPFPRLPANDDFDPQPPPLPVAMRQRIESTVEQLIALLDADDPDSDMEQEEEGYCEAGDDGCGPMFVHGYKHWGSDRDDDSVMPAYGTDQSLGPVSANGQYRSAA